MALPPGLAGNPTAIARCTAQQFNTTHEELLDGARTSSRQRMPAKLGGGDWRSVQQLEGELGRSAPARSTTWSRRRGCRPSSASRSSPPRSTSTRRLRSDDDYGITGYLRNLTQAKRVTAARVIDLGDAVGREPRRDAGGVLEGTW